MSGPERRIGVSLMPDTPHARMASAGASRSSAEASHEEVASPMAARSPPTMSIT